MKEKIRVVGYGIGAIGARIARFIIEEKKGIEYVGAIDIDPEKVGKDLGEVIGLERSVGVKISDDADKVLSETKPDLVIHTTLSFFEKVYPQVAKAVEHGANVISTCEELAYPYIVNEALAKKLDALAKEHGVTVLGTGINPGFLMDVRPIVLTGPCMKVERIKVVRCMNAATRRIPFQKKIGAGMTVEEFKQAIEKKKITGHVGLEQSIALIASAIGWELEKIDVGPVEPVVLEKRVSSDYVTVEPGKVAGLKQTARGIVGGKPLIELEFIAYIGAPEEYDLVEIEGLPKISAKISPCTHGDYGTVGMVVNMIPKVINAPPGLFTMKDLPIPSATMASMEKFLK